MIKTKNFGAAKNEELKINGNEVILSESEESLTSVCQTSEAVFNNRHTEARSPSERQA